MKNPRYIILALAGLFLAFRVAPLVAADPTPDSAAPLAAYAALQKVQHEPTPAPEPAPQPAPDPQPEVKPKPDIKQVSAKAAPAKPANVVCENGVCRVVRTSPVRSPAPTVYQSPVTCQNGQCYSRPTVQYRPQYRPVRRFFGRFRR